jgi:phage terminase large subunit GpA-like protein
MEWVKTRERNEALDCRVINRAVASLAGLDRLRPEQVATVKQESVANASEDPHTTKKRAGKNATGQVAASKV